MLVLSRNVSQNVRFPDLVESVESQVVRLGGVKATAPQQSECLDREMAHELRNRLNAATLALALLRKQRELGLAADPDAIDRLGREVEAMRAQLEGASAPPASGRTPPASVAGRS